MKPTRIISFGVCAFLFFDLVQTIVYFFCCADAWYWKKWLSSLAIEVGFLSIFSERDISVLVVAGVLSTLLLATAGSILSFVSLCVASFIVHYLIETLIDKNLKLFALACFVPSVVMSQSMYVQIAMLSEVNTIPACALMILFAVQMLLNACC